jgi:hypothetical protein
VDGALPAVGDGAVVRPPFFCDYGYNIRLGEGVFLNFNCVILDVVQVTIGSGAQIGPAVQIYAADHPRDATARRTGAECLDRRRRHHSPGRHDRRQRRHRGRGGRHPQRAEREDRRGQSRAAALKTRTRAYERWFATVSLEGLSTRNVEGLRAFVWDGVYRWLIRAGRGETSLSRSSAEKPGFPRVRGKTARPLLRIYRHGPAATNQGLFGLNAVAPLCQKSSPAVCADTHNHLPSRLAQSSV